MAIAYHGHPILVRQRITIRARLRPAPTRGLSLPAGEHALLRETGPGGAAHYVATERGLYHREASESTWHRIAWVDVAFVEHSRSTHTLVLHRWPDQQQPSTELALVDGSRLGAFAREQIAACQILVRHVHLDGGTTAIITARRERGAEATTWTAHLDPRHQPGHRDLAAIDDALREIRGQAGC